MIIAHQRLRDAPIPVNEDPSVFHCQRFVVPQTMLFPPEAMINGDATLVISCWMSCIIYQEKLRIWEAPPQVTETG